MASQAASRPHMCNPSAPRFTSPAVGGQGAAGPSASIPSPWVAVFDSFSLAQALSLHFGVCGMGRAFPAWFGVHTKWRRGTKFRGAGTYPSCWGPSHSVTRMELRCRRPSTRNTPGVVCRCVTSFPPAPAPPTAPGSLPEPVKSPRNSWAPLLPPTQKSAGRRLRKWHVLRAP